MTSKEDSSLLKNDDVPGNEGQNYTEDDIASEKKPRVPSGCTLGRIVNLAISFNYVLVFLLSIIVAGLLGVLNKNLAKNHPDGTNNTRVCILFSQCDDIGDSGCLFRYNSSGACSFLEAGFVIVAIIAFVYIAVCIVRAIFALNVWMTVFVDLFVTLGLIVAVFTMGITISVGLAITCSSAKHLYGGKYESCNSSLLVPNKTDPTMSFPFHNRVNASQSCAWLCFLFLVVALIIDVLRAAIFCRRRQKVPSMDNTNILTAEDNIKPGEDDAKAV